MPWSRNTKWRQGSILAQKDFKTVGSINTSEAEVAVAISHDCDIANDNLDVEPVIEFMAARVIENPNGNYTYAKNPRTLHADYQRNGKTIHLELTASNKFVVGKTKLISIRPDENYQYSYYSRQILQSWLASRYRRHALPNSLVARLSGVFSYIAKAGKREANGILSLHIDYAPRDELQPEEPYELWISIVYTTDNDRHCEVSEELAMKLEGEFSKLLEKTKDEGAVDLRKCKAVSEMEFTLRDMRETVKLSLEYLSYRSEPFGPVAE